MQTKENTIKGNINEIATFGNSMMSIPSISNIKSTYVKALNSELELSSCYVSANPIQDILSEQHPLINTWLLLSSISIFFLSAILFVI